MRAPIITGPAWNDDGSVKPEWEAWFNSVSNMTATTMQKVDADSTGINMAQPVSNIDPRAIIAMSVAYSLSLIQSSARQKDDVPSLAGRGAVFAQPAFNTDLVNRPHGFVPPKIFTCTQATFPTLIQLVPDTFIFVSDYLHFIYWDGTTPVMITSNEFVAIGEPDGTAPRGGLWGVCNGSAYNVLRPDGTLVSVGTQNLSGGRFIRGNSIPDAGASASTPTWQAGAVTDDESAHTHSVPGFSGTTGSDNGGGTAVQSGAGATVAAHPHDHNDGTGSSTSGTGTPHHHDLSNTNARMNAPSDANGGLPDRISVVFYMRR